MAWWNRWPDHSWNRLDRNIPETFPKHSTNDNKQGKRRMDERQTDQTCQAWVGRSVVWSNPQAASDQASSTGGWAGPAGAPNEHTRGCDCACPCSPPSPRHTRTHYHTHHTTPQASLLKRNISLSHFCLFICTSQTSSFHPHMPSTAFQKEEVYFFYYQKHACFYHLEKRWDAWHILICLCVCMCLNMHLSLHGKREGEKAEKETCDTHSLPLSWGHFTFGRHAAAAWSHTSEEKRGGRREGGRLSSLSDSEAGEGEKGSLQPGGEWAQAFWGEALSLTFHLALEQAGRAAGVNLGGKERRKICRIRNNK